MANPLYYYTYSRAEGFHYRPIERMTAGFPFLKEGGGTSSSADVDVLVFDPTTTRNVPKKNFPNSGIYVPPVIVTPPVNTGPQTDPSLITWEAPITITGSADVTYTGRNFRSNDGNIPAVYFNNYSGKATFINCNFFGYSLPNTGRGIIGSNYYCGVRLSVNNSGFFSGNPMVAGRYPGHVFMFDGFKSVTMTNCDCYGTSGIYLMGWAGNAAQADNTVTITKNRFYNIDGRFSDPTASDGWKHGNIEGTDKTQVQMIQLNTCIGIPRVLIEDNLCVNEAGKSRVEDIVSTYKSSGTSTSPIIINRNLFSGQYIYDYAFNPTTSVYYGNNMPNTTAGWFDARGFQSSGGGGLAGDGAGNTYLTDSAFIKYTNNTVLGMSNYGLGFAAGHDFTMQNNTILRSGYVRGITSRDVRIAWRHVPIQIQDYNTGSGASVDDGTGTGTNRVRWYNNDVMDNTFGYTAYDPRNAGAKGNDNMLVISPLRTNTNNNRILDVTRQQEDDAYNAHLALWASLSKTVGRTS